MIKVIQGDALEVLKGGSDNVFDSLVTDPPAGISFLGQKWDSNKGSRDAWIAWLTQIMLEANRVLKPGAHALIWALPRTSHWTATAVEDAGFDIRHIVHHHFSSGYPKSKYSLKPATEHWILARKTFNGSIKANVKRYGTGGLNIDESRIPAFDNDGRFPADMVLSHSIECQVEKCAPGCPVAEIEGQSPGSSRFFYVSKPSRTERNLGLEGLPEKGRITHNYLGRDMTKATNAMGAGERKRIERGEPAMRPTANFHTTVKSLTLLRYLCRLITPKNGFILDCFAGSGTTAVAACLENFDCYLIEKEPKYIPIIKGRIAWAEEQIRKEAA